MFGAIARRARCRLEAGFAFVGHCRSKPLGDGAPRLQEASNGQRGAAARRAFMTSEERNHFDARLLLRLFKIVLILEGAGKIIAARLF